MATQLVSLEDSARCELFFQYLKDKTYVHDDKTWYVLHFVTLTQICFEFGFIVLTKSGKNVIFTIELVYGKKLLYGVALHVRTQQVEEVRAEV